MNLSSYESDLARVFRAESGRILASLLMLTRDISLAEDALQDAILQALQTWQNALPNNPAAWLLTVARRRLIDRIRKESHRQTESTLQNVYEETVKDPVIIDESLSRDEPFLEDERLRLIFTCCHPALAESVRVPLTLKTLCGLSVREIARAYLSTETAMNQRLTRAKQKIRDAGITYEVPTGEALNGRLNSVLSVIYLIYNESYSAFEGQTLTREDLANEAIYLARILSKLLPHPNVDGLLALLLLHDSRRKTRASADQTFIPLEHQNRIHWDQSLINEGVQLTLASLAKNSRGQYQLQASISALHALAPSWQETDWPQIQQIYTVLMQHHPSPVIGMNYALAQAYGGDIDIAYQTLCSFEKILKNYQPFYVAKAKLEQLKGNVTEAIIQYDHAIAITQNMIEKDFLISQRLTLQIKINN